MRTRWLVLGFCGSLGADARDRRRLHNLRARAPKARASPAFRNLRQSRATPPHRDHRRLPTTVLLLLPQRAPSVRALPPRPRRPITPRRRAPPMRAHVTRAPMCSSRKRVVRSRSPRANATAPMLAARSIRWSVPPLSSASWRGRTTNEGRVSPPRIRWVRRATGCTAPAATAPKRQDKSSGSEGPDGDRIDRLVDQPVLERSPGL